MNRILTILAVIGGFVVAALGIKNERLQRRSAERETDIAKASEKATSAATEALVRGLNEEDKPIVRNGNRIK